MKIYWSPAAKGFFSPDLHGDMPDDAVAVSAKTHAKLLKANAEGAVIVTGPDDKPVALFPIAPPLAERQAKAIARVKREAARRIDAVFPVWAQLNSLRGTSNGHEDPRSSRLDAIRHASGLIEADIMATDNPEAMPIADHPLWPELGPNQDA